MTDLYEKSTNMFAHMSVPWQQRIISDFLDGGKTRATQSIDVGSGIGNNTGTLLGFSEHVTAIDISERALAVLTERHKEFASRLVAQKMDATELDFPNDTFDVVVCTEMLEHALFPEKILGECVRVLRPGGVLIVSCPNYMNPAGLMKKVTERLFPNHPWDAWGTHEEGRENFITAFKLEKWTRDAGGEICVTRGGDIIRSWLPFFRKYYEFIDQYPFLQMGRVWPIKFFLMNYFILAKKPSSPR